MLCIGHRGAAGHAPENTLAAIRKGIELGTDWLEIDIYCVEGELVVFHDDRLERTTNGQGYIFDQSFASLRALDAGQGERIPTLAEVFQEIQQAPRPVGLNLELKGPQTAQAVVEFLQMQPWDPARLCISSFQIDQLKRVRKLSEWIPLGVLYWNLPPEAIATAQSLAARSIHLRLEQAEASRIRRLQKVGFQVWVYTVNDASDLMQMRSLGVDAVFTDYPDRAVVLTDSA